DSLELVHYHMPVEQPPATASYIIFKKGNKTYAKNGTYGHIEFESTDSKTVIQNAIDNTESGIILIKKGTYEITERIALKNYITLMGEGKHATKLLVNGATGKIDGIGIHNTTGVRIANLWIDCKTYDQRATIAGSNVNDCTVYNCKLENLDEIFAVYFAGPSSPDVENEVLDKNNKLINCDIYGEYGADVLSWSYQMDSQIIGCNIYGRVALYKGKNHIFANNIIYGSPNQGMWITGNYYNLNIHDNIFRNLPNGSGIVTTNNVYGLKISANLFLDVGSTNGQAINLQNYCEAEIENNKFYKTNAKGVLIQCDGKVVLNGNTFFDCNTNNNSWYNGGAMIVIFGNKNLLIIMENNIIDSYNTNGVPLVINDNDQDPTARGIFINNAFNTTNPFYGSNHPTLGDNSYTQLSDLISNYLAQGINYNNISYTDTSMALLTEG
ncbi:MAG: hypothetical protein DRP01_07730, partial [Archaeoglobales archaeon]